MRPFRPKRTSSMSTQRSLKSSFQSIRIYLRLVGIIGLLACAATGMAAEPASLPKLSADMAQANALRDAAYQGNNSSPERRSTIRPQSSPTPAWPKVRTREGPARVQRFARPLSAHRHQHRASTPAANSRFKRRPGRSRCHQHTASSGNRRSFLLDRPGVYQAQQSYSRPRPLRHWHVRSSSALQYNGWIISSFRSGNHSRPALLHPDLDVWLGEEGLPNTLEFVDPVREGRWTWRAASIAWQAADARFRRCSSQRRNGLPEELLTPASLPTWLASTCSNRTNRQIPLVLVHGTQSGMTTWGDLVNDLHWTLVRSEFQVGCSLILRACPICVRPTSAPAAGGQRRPSTPIAGRGWSKWCWLATARAWS